MAFPLHVSLGNNKRKKPKSRQTIKDKEEKMSFAERKAEHEIKLSALEEAMLNPAWKHAYISKKCNIELPKPPSLLEQKRAEFADKILSQVNFDEDEELRDRAHEWITNNMFVDTADGRGSRRYRRDRDYDGGGVSRIVQDVEALREAAEALGYKGSGNSWLKDIGQALAPILIQLLVARQGQGGEVPQLGTQPTAPLPPGQAEPVAPIVPLKGEAPPPTEIINEVYTYTAVMADGSVRNMNEAEYQQWMREKQATPTAAQGLPTQPVREETQTPEPEPQVADMRVLMPDGSERRMSSAEYAVWKKAQEATPQAPQSEESSSIQIRP